jgi:galactose mutarotase-like enzyme
MADDLLTISSGALGAAINPLGAELWSLADGQGHALMTDADPAFWTGHAPLLFPIVGRLRDGRYRLGGRHFEMAQHGIARKLPFVLVEQAADRLLLRLEADDATRASYPFDFRLDMAFALAGAILHMTAHILNTGAEAMPFSFGYHPAFAWPLPYGGAVEDHRIIFEKAEPGPIRCIAEGGLIGPELVATPVAGDVLAPTHAMFEDDALIWDRLESRSLTWGVPGRPSLRIDFPDTPMLGLWQKPGARYLCVEPWAGIADPAGFVGDFRDKPGIMSLAPGESRAFRMDVTLTDI